MPIAWSSGAAVRPRCRRRSIWACGIHRDGVRPDDAATARRAAAPRSASSRISKLRRDRRRDRRPAPWRGCRSMPIGQTQPAIASSASPTSRKARDEARALGGAADQADIGKALRRQRRRDDGEIERMAVASSPATKAPSGARGERLHGIVGRSRSVHLAGTCAGKASGRGSTQVTANGNGASASTSARPTWPAPNRQQRRRSSPKRSTMRPSASRA